MYILARHNEIENNVEECKSSLLFLWQNSKFIRPLDRKCLRYRNVHTRYNKTKIKENHTDMYYYFYDLEKVNFDNL